MGHAKQAMEISTVVKFVQADYAIAEEARIGLATQAASPGLKIARKTVVAARTTTAKALSGSLAGVGIILGI